MLRGQENFSFSSRKILFSQNYIFVTYFSIVEKTVDIQTIQSWHKYVHDNCLYEDIDQHVHFLTNKTF